MSKSENTNSRLFSLNSIQTLGFLSAIVVTVIYILLVPVQGNTDWDAFFNQLAATLLGAPILSVLAIILNIVAYNKSQKYLVNFSSEALYSTPVMPFAGFLLVIISET